MAVQSKDIKIEGTQAVWDLRMEGPIKGTYSGTFRFRCFLTPIQSIAAGREYRELLGANMALAMEHESALAWALCQLKYRVISAPPFWGSENPEGGISGNLSDELVITEVLNAAIASENKYMEQIKKRKEEAIIRAKRASEAILEQKEEKKESKEKAEDET